jgi:hypothetical protein
MDRKVIRHGDLVFIEVVDSVDMKGAQETTQFTAGYGETTGHTHVITAERAFRVFENNGTRIYDFPIEVEIKHQEHAPLIFFPGKYVQVQEVEKDWFSLSVRKVID